MSAFFNPRARFRRKNRLLRFAVMSAGIVITCIAVYAYEQRLLTIHALSTDLRGGESSLWGYWNRLFDVVARLDGGVLESVPFVRIPWLGHVLASLSAGALVWLFATICMKTNAGSKDDLLFALTLSVMVLVNPFPSLNAYLLLLIPSCILWAALPNDSAVRLIFVYFMVLAWTKPLLTLSAFRPRSLPTTPVESLGISAEPFYAALGIFLLCLGQVCERTRQWCRWNTVYWLGAVMLISIWAHMVTSIIRIRGLFEGIGVDFGIYYSIAKAWILDGPLAMYDLDLITLRLQPLRRYYAVQDAPLITGPGPYPAVYILPFLFLSIIPPVPAFIIWALTNISIAGKVIRGMAVKSRVDSWGFVAMGVLFQPIAIALMVGQLSIVMLYGVYRSFSEFAKGRDFYAGLWCGLLYLKPQLTVFFALVFLIKRRWRALAGLITAGFLILVSSIMVVGFDGVLAHYQTMRSMAGFRGTLPIIGPQAMINWRGVLISILPRDVSEAVGLNTTLALSLFTTSLLFGIWRGEWNPRGPRFARQFLATLIIAMLSSFHTHIHSAALLIVPAISILLNDDRKPLLRTLLLGGYFVPQFVFFFTGSVIVVAWCFTALMLATLICTIVIDLTTPSQHSLPAQQPVRCQE
jgi:hypothetical protein